MQDLCNSLEAALKQRVESGGYAVTVLTGQGDFAKQAPCLVIYASQGGEFPLGSGNWNINVDCSLMWPAEGEDLVDYRQLCTDVFGLLMADDMAGLLSNADGLTVQGIHSRETERGVEGSMWNSSLRFVCYCYINDVVEA